MSAGPSPIYWRQVELRPNETRPQYVCKVCNDGRQREARNTLQHESTVAHQQLLPAFEAQLNLPAPLPLTHLDPTSPTPESAQAVDHTIRFLLSTLTNSPSIPPYPVDGFDENPFEEADQEEEEDDDEYPEGLVFDQTPYEALSQQIGEGGLDVLNEDLSDEELQERPEVDVPQEAVEDVALDSDELRPAKRPRGYAPDPQTAKDWFPWLDKIVCVLDLLMHLPRSLFSERQLGAILWAMAFTGGRELPSVDQMKGYNKTLQSLCGINTIPHKGVFGNLYSLNDISQIVAQEMSNPQVRPHLTFYPEDAGERLEGASQGERWLHNLPPGQTTPMHRIAGVDYYIYEPCMLHDGSFCIPTRWFVRGRTMMARAWPISVVGAYDNNGDQHRWWEVHEDREIDVPEHAFLIDFLSLKEKHTLFDVPHPAHLLSILRPGVYFSPPKWTYTNPQEGNPWRTHARGHRVYALPIWLYCNDTSGNQSKKWNEHNSFLFTLAGLPLEHVMKQFNIHFLCTSNIAPPLEMLDGVVSQLEDAEIRGIWAWDSQLQELVLVFVVVLALLGDNPMQSELACHIGLAGKYFCRICWVHKGAETSARGKPKKRQAKETASANHPSLSTPTSSRPASPVPTSSRPASPGVATRSKLMTDLRIRLEDTFSLTKEQRTIIRRLSERLMFAPTRVSFKGGLLQELLKTLRDEAQKETDKFKVGNCYETDAREVELVSESKAILSSVRNGCRAAIRDSLIGPGRCSLSECTVDLATRYLASQAPPSDKLAEKGYTAKVVILASLGYHLLLPWTYRFPQRHIAMENRDILSTVEATDPGPELVINTESEGPSSTTPGQGKKRKRAKGGRVAAGDDFWGIVESWYAKEIETRGHDFGSPGWKQFIKDIIAADNLRSSPQASPSGWSTSPSTWTVGGSGPGTPSGKPGSSQSSGFGSSAFQPSLLPLEMRLSGTNSPSTAFSNRGDESQSLFVTTISFPPCVTKGSVFKLSNHPINQNKEWKLEMKPQGTVQLGRCPLLGQDFCYRLIPCGLFTLFHTEIPSLISHMANLMKISMPM
ncbi:hypothetical protein BKA70DRAFT_1446935 [Coprinopsis sp. MPI-PUGE-AT-0042]|nr:hypothetical protein BKA70DRAFT_1446935 [Coprinopsis sp. MPI-PUGE-AT-0042]